MNTTGTRTGRMMAYRNSSLRIVEGMAMDTHIRAHRERLLNQAAAERFAMEGAADSVRQSGFARRLRSRLGRAIIGFGRSIEGSGHEAGAAGHRATA